MNRAKLEYEMAVRGVSTQELCSAIGISRSAYYRKCNGTSEFTLGEIQRIVDLLGLKSPMGIFLMQKCLKRNGFKGCMRGGEGRSGR